ncbi:MAG: transcription antitermination factor NusB [Myxococcota bacterium]|nr:transcription antitermination factor NusB [Myxococcota bacterium]
MKTSSRLNPGRMAAGRVLVATLEGHHADSELDRQDALSAADRRLAWHLIQGVLRHRGELDEALNQVSNRPVAELDRPVQTALRIGAFELRHSRTPPHAAVDQGVRLATALKAGRAKGLVNALLRRVGNVKLQESPTRNHPDWLVERWTARFGAEATANWCLRNDLQAPLAIACRHDVEGLRERLGDHAERCENAVFQGKTLERALVLEGVRGAIAELPGFSEGEWWVMDPAAMATADLLKAKSGERVLDVCAAPGGKSLRLAASGAVVTATDRSRSRLKRLSENAKRVGFSLELQEVDWSRPGSGKIEPVDAVLVDAPCTGLGTLRRHPEIRWRSLPSDPLAMSLIQQSILSSASGSVNPGGRLVYAVCSPEPEEGVQVVEAFLETHPDFGLDAVLDSAPPSADEDAFFAARLVRRKA